MTQRGIAGTAAIVTGGGSGMGAATASRLADEGARVAVVDVREDAAEAVAAAIGDAAIAVAADVSTPEGGPLRSRACAGSPGRLPTRRRSTRRSA